MDTRNRIIEFDMFVKQEATKTNTRFIKKRKRKPNHFHEVCHRDGYKKPHLKSGKIFLRKSTNKRALGPWVAHLRMTDQWSVTICENIVECIMRNNSMKIWVSGSGGDVV